MGRERKSRRSLCAACMALVLGAAAPCCATAQETAAGQGSPVPSDQPETGIFGRVPERRRVIPAFWRTHPFDQRFPELAYTRGVGLQASGWLAGAFLNSYDRLSLIAGVERAWADEPVGRVARVGIGYRAGLLTGYDERLVSWADDTPVLPFFGVLGWAQVGRVGVDAFYVYRAITIEGSVAF